MVAALDLGHESQACELSRKECVEMLGTVGIARVILSVGCIPFAVPANIAVRDAEVVFAADGGSKLTPSVYGQVVSVEADDIDLVSHKGWSVLVTGIAQAVTAASEIDWAAPLLRAWVSEPHPMLVRVPLTLVSGRRLMWSDLSSSGVNS
ncbi:MAG: pyridoxamine 5'-phosphate oxidase family protein [Acidimicrobiales bacterium]